MGAIAFRTWIGMASRLLRIQVGVLASLAYVDPVLAIGADAKLGDYYSAPSKHCTEFKNGKFQSCAKLQRDCLRLVPGATEMINMEAHSFQANGQSCSLNGQAQIEDGGVIFRAKDAYDREWTLRVIVNSDTLVLRYLTAPGTLSPFCGTHASLDRLTFSRRTRQADGRVCFTDE